MTKLPIAQLCRKLDGNKFFRLPEKLVFMLIVMIWLIFVKKLHYGIDAKIPQYFNKLFSGSLKYWGIIAGIDEMCAFSNKMQGKHLLNFVK